MSSINLCKCAAGFPDFLADELLPDLFKKKKLGVKWCMYITRVSTKNTNQTSL